MTRKILLFCLGVIISGVIIFACNKSDDNGNEGNGGGNGGGNPPPASGNKVSIANMSFSVSSLTVKTGTTVTWTNNDSAPHTVTADDNSFDSGNIAVGAAFSRTFSTAGTINYHCTIHTSMKGSVVVN